MGESWVPLAVAVIGGGVGLELLRMLSSWWRGRTTERRTEVDRAIGRMRDAEKRAHLTLVFARRLELLCAQYGVPAAEMPTLDFGEKTGGE